MAKIQVKYENDIEKINIIQALSKELVIKNISKAYKSGKYYRVYIDIEHINS